MVMTGGAYAVGFGDLGMGASEIGARFSEEGRVLHVPVKDRAAGPSTADKIGIGSFETTQILVLKFMRHVGWDEGSMYEETGLTMQNLLLKMVRTDKEARRWLEEMNQYFESSGFLSQNEQKKQEDIFNAKVLAKMSINALGLTKLNSAAANKGSQRSTQIENARYRVQSGKLNISGLALEKPVAGDIQNAQVTGNISGVNCTGPSTPCYGEFHIAGSRLLLDISIDQDHDGNPEKIVRNVLVGSVTQGEAAFFVPVKPVFVEDRYSFAEHLMGAKDVNFVAMTVEVSVK